ncbi:cation diffusion facilitator family transporter [Aromatoleum toluvorans]|uniref:Cation diffusion facilitator family transporter n=1 Tax=Aromatoleum toluvorans TaxID=92002 RepID=A0ABX1PYB4_9RHOO|nr:cation diffusion facilitator family transporter [Aromatoleum toluvorans]NMG43605.1 cation diffusion facilitator family transporter [Aromatoleum toluvorans]
MDHPTARNARSTGRDDTRARGIQRTALTAIVTNTLLSAGQIVVGLFANAFSLVADSAHTLSDLFTDFLVLIAGRRGAEPADRDHPYGHGRIETAVSMLLGAVLAVVGMGFLWSSGLRLQHMAAAPPLHPAALGMALVTLAAKEILFRYTLAASRRLKAPVLEANAWHARSDAASSLVVAIGIGGSLAGYPFLEPLAAAVVGFLIVHMGIRLVWRAVRELIDTGLSEQEVSCIRDTIRTTPGVIGLHDLRTRRMADRVLCDAHIQVDPRITVSEGHRISDTVYFRVRAAHPEVREVLVHVDSEDDAIPLSAGLAPLPGRTEIVHTLEALFGDALPVPPRVLIHYLGDRIEAEVILSTDDLTETTREELRLRIEALLAERPHYRAITILGRIAP